MNDSVQNLVWSKVVIGWSFNYNGIVYGRWLCMEDGNCNKIEQVQRSSARFVTGKFDRHASVTSMLRDLQWPSLQSRRQLSRLSMLYRIRFNMVDINWRQYLTESTSCTRGHNSRFQIPHCSSQTLISSHPSSIVPPENGTNFRRIQLTSPALMPLKRH